MLNKAFTEQDEKYRKSQQMAEALEHDLERRKAQTADFKMSGNGGMSPLDELYLAVARWKAERDAAGESEGGGELSVTDMLYMAVAHWKDEREKNGIPYDSSMSVLDVLYLAVASWKAEREKNGMLGQGEISPLDELYLSVAQWKAAREKNDEFMIPEDEEVINTVLFEFEDLENVDSSNICECQSSVFGGNKGHVLFYLPRLAIKCNCGQLSDAYYEDGDCTALETILRPWQALFIHSLGIHSTKQFIEAVDEQAKPIAKLMRKWRKHKKMIPIRTKHCIVALRIWSKTCKQVLQSLLEQEITGAKPHIPEFLTVSIEASDEVTASTAGG
jgi:hypothetical protein